MPREKGFSEEQNQKKQEIIKNNGYALLEDIKGDIIIKNPSKISIELNDGTTKSIDDLIETHNAVMKIRKSDLCDALVSLLK